MIFQEKIFSPAELKSILELTSRYTQLFAIQELPHNTINRDTNLISMDYGGFQKEYTCYTIPRNPETQWLFSKLLTWFSKISKIQIIPYSEKESENRANVLTIHKYQIGNKFDKHIDISEIFNNRRYNIGIQLTDNYTGGDYLIWDDRDNQHVFNKEAGTALAYKATLAHQITSITSGERWSLVFPINKFDIVEKLNLL